MQILSCRCGNIMRFVTKKYTLRRMSGMTGVYAEMEM